MAPAAVALFTAYIPQITRPEAETGKKAREELWTLRGARARKGAVIITGGLNSRLHARMAGEAGVLGPRIYGLGVAGLEKRWRETGEEVDEQYKLDEIESLYYIVEPFSIYE